MSEGRFTENYVDSLSFLIIDDGSSCRTLARTFDPDLQRPADILHEVMQGLQEQNGHVSRPARMRLWRYSMEHTGGTTEVPNYFYQISDAGTVKNAIL